VDAAKPVIQSRIQRYASKEIRFNLMAIGKSRLAVYRNELAQNTARLAVCFMV
jgi:hypothetical protein